MTQDWTSAWRRAVVREQRAAARGTQLTVVELGDALPFPFEPGHVVALRLETPAGLMRHPYTVCMADEAARRLGFIYRVIPEGRLTPSFTALEPGGVVEISGLHHAPIREEVDPAAETFVGFGTSSGLGPLWGYAARALAQGETRPLHLVVGVREEADLPLRAELEQLAARHRNFRWTPIVSRPGPGWTGLRGRVTDHAAELLPALDSVHVHLVGNMAMVRDMEEALREAGLPAHRATHEGFFNWNAEADAAQVSALAARLRARSAPSLH